MKGGSRLRVLVVAPLALVAALAPAACGKGDGGAGGGAGADTSFTSANTEPGAPPAMPDTARVDTASAVTDTALKNAARQVALAPVGNSGISGNATIVAAGNGVSITVTLRGAKGAGTHQGHVHAGTCDAPGAAVAPLQPVTTDASGAGSSSTAVSLPLSAVMNGEHVIAYHEAGGNPGKPVACGSIPLKPAGV